MSSKVLFATLLAASFVAWPATSKAQEGAYPYAPPPGYYAPGPYQSRAYPSHAYAPQYISGYHEHDGFYLRALIGPGYLHNSANINGYTSTESGVGLTMGIAIGGVVAPNLIVYGEFLATTVSDPQYDDGAVSGTENGVTATFAGVGPGIAYYLDQNLYLSGTLLFSRVSYSYDDTSYADDATDLGIGLGLTIGKEWWVSHDWGLGVSGQFLMASMKLKYYDTRLTSVGIALLFSATYN